MLDEPQATLHILQGSPVTLSKLECDNLRRDLGLSFTSADNFLLSKDEIGTFAIVEYSNLHNSNYIDSLGQKHQIAKIVRSFSNSSLVSVSPTDTLHRLVVFSNPFDGFWYNNLNGVTITDQYFDQNGKQIIIDPSTAYIAVTSLNNSGNGAHVEKATSLSGTTAYALLGSSISNHNGSLYSDNDNTTRDSSWDRVDSPNTYYGSGLLSLSGSNFSVRFSCLRNGSDHNASVWATTSTIIPQTPGPQYTGPKKPAPKSTPVHYHYDVTTNRQKIRRCRLHSILRKYDDKLLKSVNK